MSLRDFWNKRIDVAFVLSRDPMLEALDIISTARPHLIRFLFRFAEFERDESSLSRRSHTTQSLKSNARSTPTSASEIDTE
jgi:hypothetical protein